MPKVTNPFNAMEELEVSGFVKDTIDQLVHELATARRDALPCQVLDVLDHNRKLVAALTEAHALNVNWVSVAEPEMLVHLSEYKAVIAQSAAALNIR